MSIQNHIEDVSNETGVSIVHLTSGGRIRKAAFARHEVIRRAREDGQSSVAIAQALGYADHTAVCHALNRMGIL